MNNPSCVLLSSPLSPAPLCPALSFTEEVFGFSCQAFAYILQNIPTAGRNQLIQEYSPVFLYHVVLSPFRNICTRPGTKKKILFLPSAAHKANGFILPSRQRQSVPGMWWFGCPLLAFKLKQNRWLGQPSTTLPLGNEGCHRMNMIIQHKIRVTFQKQGKKPLSWQAGDAPMSMRKSVARRVPKQTRGVKGAFVRTSHPPPGKQEETLNAQNCGRRELSACRCMLSIGKCVVLMVFLQRAVSRPAAIKSSGASESVLFYAGDLHSRGMCGGWVQQSAWYHSITVC